MNAGTSSRRSGIGRSSRSSRQRRKKPWPKACWTRLPKRMRKPLRSEEKSQRKLDRMKQYRIEKIEAAKTRGKVWLHELRAIFGTCERCDTISILDVHHVRGRAGALLCNQQYWKLVCSCCHRWIHDNPEQARSGGWLAQPGDWGREP